MQIFLFSKEIYSQSRIGVKGGIHLNNQIILKPNTFPRIEMSPKMSVGYNFNLFYEKKLKENLKLRGQISIFEFQKKFEISSGGRFFTSHKEGEINPRVLNVGIVPTIEISHKPIIQIGLGLNYFHQASNPDIKISSTASNFQSGTSIMDEEIVKQSELINQNGLGLIMNLEINIPIQANLKLITGLEINQGITKFIKASESGQQVYQGIISVGLGLAQEF